MTQLLSFGILNNSETTIIWDGLKQGLSEAITNTRASNTNIGKELFPLRSQSV